MSFANRIRSTCIVLLLAAAGCSGEPETKEPSPAAPPVNANCPLMPEHPISADGGTTVWKGKTVGFCCPKCLPKWERWTDAQKDAFVGL